MTNSLQDLCDPDALYELYRHPWSLPTGRVFANDGSAMLVRDDSDVYPAFKSKGTWSTICEIRTAVYADGIVVRANTAFLRAFCGAPLPHIIPCDNHAQQECDQCKGTGEAEHCCQYCDDSHACVCAFCGGEGTTACPHCGDGRDSPAIRPARIAGMLVDRVRLARLLACVDADAVEMRAGDEHLLLRWNGGWGALMQLCDDVPVWPEEDHRD